ncbi:MAG: acyl-ACP--UDP-N-acetylglucosamine O-acyltransferase [Rhodospirillales bacterium]|nr:acyl-ACP--UDP-N-acetylglucosamine O-acyltransferase [Rhodospirillales bacterium]
MTNIHPTAIINPQAEVSDTAIIGPYCVIGPNVKLIGDVELLSHVAVDGRTTIGAGTKAFPFSSIGHQPQDLKYNGEPSELVIGENNVIREHVTINPGTEGGGMLTQIGNNCLLMVGVHVGHDCKIANHVVLVNNATLGGHVEIDDFVVFGGLGAAHQFVRIGKHAMIGGMSAVENDVIPYGSVYGNRAHLNGLNLIGLKRRGFDRDVIHALRNAYRLLFANEGTLNERVDDVAELFNDNEPVMEIVNFIQAESSRAICQPALEHAG